MNVMPTLDLISDTGSVTGSQEHIQEKIHGSAKKGQRIGIFMQMKKCKSIEHFQAVFSISDKTTSTMQKLSFFWL